MKRFSSEVNYALDELLIKPIAPGTTPSCPTPVEHSVHNLLRNLNGPVILPTICPGQWQARRHHAKRFPDQTPRSVLAACSTLPPTGSA